MTLTDGVAATLLRGGVLFLDYDEHEIGALLLKAGGSARPQDQEAFHQLIDGAMGLARDMTGRTINSRRLYAPQSAKLAGLACPVGARYLTTHGESPMLDLNRLAGTGITFLRCPVRVAPSTPPAELREYAQHVRRSQRHGLLPVVEIDTDTEERFLHKARTAATRALMRAQTALDYADVEPTALLYALRPVVPGPHSHDPGAPDDIARATLRAVTDSGIPDRAGILVLPVRRHGGSHAVSAHLAALRRADPNRPIGYGLGRSLLGRLARLWRGRPDNTDLARRELRDTFHLLSTTLRTCTQ